MRCNRYNLFMMIIILAAALPARASIDYIYDKNAKAEPALSLKEQRHWTKLAADQSCSEIFWNTPQEDLSKKDNQYCLDDNDLHNAHDYKPFDNLPVIEDTLVTNKNTLLVLKEQPGLRYIKLKYFVERDVPEDAILSTSVVQYEEYKLLLNRGGDSWQSLMETVSKRDNRLDGDNAVTKSTLTIMATDKGTLVKHTYQNNATQALEECYALDEMNRLYDTSCPNP